MAADTNQNAASPVRLSDRLGAAAGMVTPGYRLCDVGCDHAHIPIALLRAGKPERTWNCTGKTGSVCGCRTVWTHTGPEKPTA